MKTTALPAWKPWLFAAALAALQASAGVAVKPPAEASFDASGPAGFKIRGTTADVEMTEAEGFYTLRVKLATLTTGIDLRDRHMRDKYLEIEKFPFIEFKFPSASVQWDGSGTIKGTCTLHGVSKDLEVSYMSKKKDAVAKVEGSGSLNFQDFGINVPSYLGVTVKPVVKFGVKLDVALP